MVERALSVPDSVIDPVRAVWEHKVAGSLIKVVLAFGGAWFVTSTFFNATLGTFISGVSTGTLFGLMGVGIILIYRTNRIINFAAAGLGAVPGVAAALLLVVELRDVRWWYLCFPLAIVGGAIMGGLVDVLIIRRFANAPRLILTVATIGIVQILAYIALLIPIWMGSEGKPVSFVPTPFKGFGDFKVGNQIFTGDYPFTILIIVLTVGALAAFLRYTRMGIALRAAAENADRASLLGIPVKRVQTVAWVIAGGIGGLTIFQRASLVGVPTDGSLGYQVLLFALTAAVIARMESIPTCLVAGMVIGIFVSTSVVYTGADSLAMPFMLVLILGALLLQRGRFGRAYDTGTSSWQAVKEFRPIPLELRRLPEVLWVKVGILAVIALVAIIAPLELWGWRLFPVSRLGDLQRIMIISMIVVSLVVLTGWAGQISLGQFAFVGVGAAMTGKLAAEAGLDFFVVLAAGAAAGAVAAILIGLPALRIQGLYLAVTTLAFAATMSAFFLNRSYRIGELFAPDKNVRIEPPILWGRIGLTDESGIPNAGFHFFTLGFLVLVLLAARAYRRNRAGRVLIAVRENQRASSSFAVNAARTKLAGFAISGAIAASAGVLYAYQLGAVDKETYGMNESIYVFLIAVIGGLTSIMGAVVGTVVIQGVRMFGQDLVKNLDLLTTGPGLLLVLMFIPGGIAQVIYDIRDKYLRWVANRRGLIVPSLLADRRADTEAQEGIVSRAEQTSEEREAELVAAATDGEDGG